MAKYKFDDLVKAAGHGEGICDALKKRDVTEAEAVKEILTSQFRFSITDGYLVEKGGQFDYVFDFSKSFWERSDWRSGVPVKRKGNLSASVMEAAARSLSFVYQLPQKQFVTDTKSMTINTNAYEREKYGPIKRLTRCELRMGDKFFRWVVEEDEDRPFLELYATFEKLRAYVDCLCRENAD